MIQPYASFFNSQDPVGTVQKLSDFLELDRNDDLCREIAEKCHFSNMKVDKDKFSMKFGSKNIHYRKGKKYVVSVSKMSASIIHVQQ